MRTSFLLYEPRRSEPAKARMRGALAMPATIPARIDPRSPVEDQAARDVPAVALRRAAERQVRVSVVDLVVALRPRRDRVAELRRARADRGIAGLRRAGRTVRGALQ